MWFRRLLNRLGLAHDVLLCMRQEHTFVWPPHLGEKTAGKCANCYAPIFYEKQNAPFRKICNVCAHG